MKFPLNNDVALLHTFALVDKSAKACSESTFLSLGGRQCAVASQLISNELNGEKIESVHVTGVVS